MLQHAVDQSVLERLFRGHEVVALHVLGDLLPLLPGMRREDLLEPALDVDYLARLDLDVGSLALEAARNLMDQDLRVGQRRALALGAAGQEYRAHRHGDADTGRLHVGLDELHRVVNGQSGVHGAPGRVDVDGNVLVRVFGFQVDQLSDHQVGDLIVDRRAEEDDPLVEKPRIDVERALAARCLLDDHWNQRTHGVSLLPGVHNFEGEAGFSFSGVQICSRASACARGIGLTPSQMRSRAALMRMSSRNSWWRPTRQISATSSSASSPVAPDCSRTSSSISLSEILSFSLSAAASSTSSRAIERRASTRTSSTSCPAS